MRCEAGVNWHFRRNTETVAHNGLGTGRTEVGENSEEAVCNRELLHSLKVWLPTTAAILTPNEAPSSQQRNVFTMAQNTIFHFIYITL